ncbi:MAG: hypothetical protein WDO24_00685 [Pseudomonadota bacterium]
MTASNSSRWDQIHVGEQPLEALPDQGLDLGPQSGDGAERAARDSGDIIEEAIFRLHDGLRSAAAGGRRVENGHGTRRLQPPA